MAHFTSLPCHDVPWTPEPGLISRVSWRKPACRLNSRSPSPASCTRSMWEALSAKGSPRCRTLMTPKFFQHKGSKPTGNVIDLAIVSHHVICTRKGTHAVCGCQKDIHSNSECHLALPGRGLYCLVCIHSQCCSPHNNLS